MSRYLQVAIGVAGLVGLVACGSSPDTQTLAPTQPPPPPAAPTQTAITALDLSVRDGTICGQTLAFGTPISVTVSYENEGKMEGILLRLLDRKEGSVCGNRFGFHDTPTGIGTIMAEGTRVIDPHSAIGCVPPFKTRFIQAAPRNRRGKIMKNVESKTIRCAITWGS